MKRSEQQTTESGTQMVSKATLMRSIVATSAVLIVLAVAVFAYITAAWFAQNRDVDSDGMTMNVEGEANLIIKDNPTDLAAIVTPVHNPNGTPPESDLVLTFTSPAELMTPAHHVANWSTTYPSATDYTGLEWNRNPDVIDPGTGYTADSVNNAELFNAVPLYVAPAQGQATPTRYYIDYTVYIASAVKALPATKLYATLSGESIVYDYQNAASVDFYLGSVSANNYKGTLNIAHKNYATHAQQTAAEAKVDILAGESMASIPYNKATSGDTYITVIMRFYFDGGLGKTLDANGNPAQAYVYSTGLTTANFSAAVSFNAEE